MLFSIYVVFTMLFFYVWNVNIEKDTVIWKVEIK